MSRRSLSRPWSGNAWTASASEPSVATTALRRETVYRRVRSGGPVVGSTSGCSGVSVRVRVRGRAEEGRGGRGGSPLPCCGQPNRSLASVSRRRRTSCHGWRRGASGVRGAGSRWQGAASTPGLRHEILYRRLKGWRRRLGVSLSGHQFERGEMTSPYHGEVAAVEGGDGVLPEPLG